MLKPQPFIIFFLILLIIVYFYTPIFNKHSNDIESLYENFEFNMQIDVNSYLRSIDCEPQSYYYEDSSICFICDKIKPCFNYSWVERKEGQKMKLEDVVLKGEYDKVTEISFFSKGITKILNCECLDECFCEDDIKIEFYNEPNPVVLFKYSGDSKTKILKVAKYYSIENCLFENNTFDCLGKLTGFIVDGEIFAFSN